MMKLIIHQAVDHASGRLKEISAYIGSHPELGHEEFESSRLLADELEANGFTVTRGVLDIPTAFIGEYRSAKPGPTVAFLAEYDALPELGHACGHHLICTMSVGAAIGLKAAVDEAGGTIRVFGTPAEETKGAKVPMSAAGLFDDADFAMMAHPYYAFEASGSSLAMDALQFEYFGKAAHAAASPQEGVNALDAVLMLFNSVNALRQQLPDHVRIHGIITEGGKAANVIPDYAVAQFYVRAKSRPHTDETVQKVLKCAEGAAMQTGCRLQVSNYEYSYDELITNKKLSEVYTDNLIAMGVRPEEIQSANDHGSLDLGNVSRRCPSIHPFVKVVNERLLLHTPEFRDRAMETAALDAMVFTAKVLASTAYDVMSNPALLKAIREEFERVVASRE